MPSFYRQLTGGKLNATALTSIPDGAVQIRADGAGSIVDFPVLATFTDTSAVTSTVETLNTGIVHLGAGTVTLSNVDVAANGTLTAGTLSLGAGTVTGNVSNGGIVLPGNSAGALTISGSYTQTAAGALAIEIGGLTAGTEFDRLIIGGTTTLAGTLNLTLIGGFVPNLGATFPILGFASRTGTFATVTGTAIAAGKQFAVGYNAADVTLTVTP